MQVHLVFLFHSRSYIHSYFRSRNNFYFAQNKNYYEQAYPDLKFNVRVRSTINTEISCSVSIPDGYNYIIVSYIEAASSIVKINGTQVKPNSPYSVSGMSSITVSFYDSLGGGTYAQPGGTVILKHAVN